MAGEFVITQIFPEDSAICIRLKRLNADGSYNSNAPTIYFYIGEYSNYRTYKGDITPIKTMEVKFFINIPQKQLSKKPVSELHHGPFFKS